MITSRYGNTALPLHLDVFHIDDQRHPLEPSIGTARDAWVAVRGEGEYLLRVRRVPGGPLTYDLELVGKMGVLTTRRERPWRNDDVATATDLSLGHTLGTLCGDEDTDYFQYMGEQAANILVEGEVDLLSVNGGNLGDRLEPHCLSCPGQWRYRSMLSPSIPFASPLCAAARLQSLIGAPHPLRNWSRRV